MNNFFKNPSRGTKLSQAQPNIPEYRRLGLQPISVGEDGRIQESSYFHPPISGHHDVTYQVDASESYQKTEETGKTGKTESSHRDIEPGDFILMLGGQIILTGQENYVLHKAQELLLNDKVSLNDIVILKRMEVHFGLTAR